MPVNPGVYNGGAPIRGLVSLPAPATTEMLTVDAAGNMSRQAIPSGGSFASLTGLPSDNAALQSALDAKLNLSGGTLTGQLNGTTAVFTTSVQAGVFDVPQNGSNQSVYNFSSGGVARGALVFNPVRLEVGIRNNNYSSSGEYSAYVDGSGNFRLRNANVYNSSPVFTVAPTGVVTAPQLQSGTGNLLILDGGSGISIRHNASHQHAFATGSFTTRGDNVIQWTSGSDMSHPVDALFARNTTGQVDFRGDNGFRLRNFANNAFSDLQARTGTFNTNLNLSGAGSTFAPASFGLAIYRNDNGTFQWGHSYSQGFLISHSNQSIGFTHHPDSAPDVRIVRNATGPALQTQAAGGLQVRGAGGTGDGALTCGAITASGLVRTPAGDYFNAGLEIGSNTGLYDTSGLVIRHGGQECVQVNTSELSLRSSVAIGWTGTTAATGVVDTAIVRNNSGQVDVRGDSGFRVRNYANSADAALTAGAITASGNITGNIIGANSGSYFQLIRSAGAGARFSSTTDYTAYILRDDGSPNGVYFSLFDSPNYFMRLGATMALCWADTGTLSGSPTGATGLAILAEGNNVLAQRNGTSAQAFRVYHGYTNASNYARAFMDFSGATFRFGTQIAGTGGTSNMELHQNGSNIISFNSGGKIFFHNRDITFGSWNGGEISLRQTTSFNGRLDVVDALTHSTYRDIAMGRVFVGGAPATTTGLIKNTSGAMNFRLGNDSADCNITAAEALFSGSVKFSGSTSAEPMLKRSGSTIQVRLADDSGFGGMAASTGSFGSTVTIGAYTLPATDGTNGQVLTTNGSGSVTWQASGGGGGGSGVSASFAIAMAVAL